MNEILVRPHPKLILQAKDAVDSDDDDNDDNPPSLIHLEDSPGTYSGGVWGCSDKPSFSVRMKNFLYSL